MKRENVKINFMRTFSRAQNIVSEFRILYWQIIKTIWGIFMLDKLCLKFWENHGIL